jgi:TatD DNase family protein
MVTGSDLVESEKAIELCTAHPNYLYCTVGIHPCSSQTFVNHPKGAEHVLSCLRTLAETHTQSDSPVVAFGEIGLDYDRLGLCPKDIQLEYFARQLDVAIEVDLPLFLHSRAAHEDFARLLRERSDRLPRRGVVHSFTGELHEMEELIAMGFDIGINGCSLKTPENVEVVRQVPLERLQLETDGPWCEMRASHASAEFLKGPEAKAIDEMFKSVKKEKWVEGAMVKGRNEPCTIGKVAIAVAGIKGISVEELTEKAWENTTRMFGLGER